MIRRQVRCQGPGRTREHCNALLATNVTGHVEIECKKCHHLNVVDAELGTHWAIPHLTESSTSGTIQAREAAPV